MTTTLALEDPIALPAALPRPGRVKSARLGSRALVKGTLLQAHIAWAEVRLGRSGLAQAWRTLPASDALYEERGVMATEWVPFATLVRLDQAIAAAAGGLPDATYRAMGLHSAHYNLRGAYKAFVHEEPHRFFESTGRLHARLMAFGECAYERRGDRLGRLRFTGYDEYSPVFCTSALGYWEGALEAMRAPGPIVARETRCQCAGDEACLFEVRW